MKAARAVTTFLGPLLYALGAVADRLSNLVPVRR